MNDRMFPLRVVLTVTTGRMLTERKGDRDNGIGDLYEILDHMTGDSAFTHQLPRFQKECTPWLLRWFPELASVDVDDLDAEIAKAQTPYEGVEDWLENLAVSGKYKAEYSVGRIPRDDHDVKNPFDELVEMRGTDEGIVIMPAKPNYK